MPLSSTVKVEAPEESTQFGKPGERIRVDVPLPLFKPPAIQ
jgi:hypothetical protein